jgi:hypothetical protein
MPLLEPSRECGARVVRSASSRGQNGVCDDFAAGAEGAGEGEAVS